MKEERDKGDGQVTWTTLLAESGLGALFLLLLKLVKLLGHTAVFLTRTGWVGVGICTGAGLLGWWLVRRARTQ